MTERTDTLRQHIPLPQEHTEETKRKARLAVAIGVPRDQVKSYLDMLGLS